MKDFLKKYDTVIFDMDGVITSENGYWNSAALTVYEYMYGKDHFGTESIDGKYLSDNVKAVRKEMFSDDKLITLFKGMGVNSNWDLGYITLLISLVINSRDSKKIYEYAKGINEDIITAYDTLARQAAMTVGASYEEYKRNGKLWCDMRDTFQEWYLGDEKFSESYERAPYLLGKPGIYKSEEPLIPLSELKLILSELAEDKRLCVGTGRPYIEIVPLLKGWGVLDLFDTNGICTYDEVRKAEKEIGLTLTKPHPYMFLKALCGLDYPDDKLISGEYDKEKIKKLLVVGDAGADILASKTMGADFCAVLTGVAGKNGKAYFEEQKAEYILNSIKDMR